MPCEVKCLSTLCSGHLVFLYNHPSVVVLTLHAATRLHICFQINGTVFSLHWKSPSFTAMKVMMLLGHFLGVQNSAIFHRMFTYQ